jgi:hypothetical protein
MSVRAVVLERLLADPISLDILLSDSEQYNIAKDILWRKDNMPALKSTVYTDNSYGDVYDWIVLEHHMDYSISVVSPHDPAQRDRLKLWRKTPNAN